MSEIGTTFLGRRMRSFRSSPEFDGFSKVVIVVSDEIEYSAGTDSGRTLRLTNPWGTPQMAQNILSSIRGFQYQPFEADGAILDPAAELGDGITANNVYSGVYTKKIKFGPLLTATVAAPEDEEINHEYPYKSKPNKEITREAKMLRASLAVEAARITAEVAERKSAVEMLTAMLQVQAEKIEAKVSKTGGSVSSFEWSMTDTYMLWKANGSKIFNLDKNGAEVYGKIVAKSGKIGGFDILEDHLSYNNQKWNGTNSTGIYLGPSGFQLGKYFRVTNAGKLYAESGEFAGTVHARSIAYGGDYGTFSGSGITGGSIVGNRLARNTVSTAYTSGGINTSLGYADFSHDVFNGNDRASTVWASSLRVGSSGTQFTKQTISFIDGLGNTRSYTVLAVAS